MVGGGLYFVTGLIVFAITFNGLNWPWYISKGLADILGWSLNYAVQRYWAFSNSKLKGQDRRVVSRFVLVNAVDLIFDYAIVAACIAWVPLSLNLRPYIGFALSASFTTIWDYLWYRFWVFKPKVS
jgi:putative flippase GtrA